MNASTFWKIFGGGKTTAVTQLTATETKSINGGYYSSFAEVRNAASGAIFALASGISCGKSEAGTEYAIMRMFSMFDLSSIPGEIVTAKLKVWQANNTVDKVQAQLCGNTGAIALADYSNITGDYGNANATETISSKAYKVITLNASGLAKLNEKGTVRLCARDYDYDYLNVAPSRITYQHSDSSTSYLELTYQY